MALRKCAALVACLMLLFAAFAGCSGGNTEQDPPDAGQPGTQQPLEPETLTFTESAREDRIQWYGRCYHDAAEGTVSISNASAGFEVAFYGTRLEAEIFADASQMRPPELSGNGYAYLFLDGETSYKEATLIELPDTGGAAQKVVLAEGLEEGEHTAKLIKVTEAKYTGAYVKSVTSDGGFRQPPARPAMKIEIVGDSISAGANAMRTQDADLTDTGSENSLASYGAVAAGMLGAEFNTVCRSGLLLTDSYANIFDYYEKYGERDPAAWDFSLYVPDAVIVDLGTNDKLLGISDAAVRAAYKRLLDLITEKYPHADIFCCTGAMSSVSADIAAQLGAIAAGLAEEYGGRVTHVELPVVSTAGHPKEADHRSNGLYLTSQMRRVMQL